MHAVVVRVKINDFEQARRFLTEQVVPGASSAPGFVAGYWVRAGESNGLSMIVYESEDAARGIIDRIQDPPGDAAEIESVDVHEVVASA